MVQTDYLRIGLDKEFVRIDILGRNSNIRNSEEITASGFNIEGYIFQLFILNNSIFYHL